MKKTVFFFIGLIVCPVLVAQQAETVSEHRIALVIGNGDYLNGPLKNTVNDARSMARALRNSGFEVMLNENVSNKDEMKRLIREFGMKLTSGGTALFYYAGHGMQVGGFNYLIPVNAVIQIEEEVEYEAIDVGFILAYMESAGTMVNIVILDACRNNPFARSFRNAKQGLTSMTAPAGTLIAYSTAPGSVASDGPGVNGLYTQELLMQLSVPGLKVEEVFKNVRREVMEISEGRQTPWESSSLIGDFYFSKSQVADIPQEESYMVTETDLQQKKSDLQVSGAIDPAGVKHLSGSIPYSSIKSSGNPVSYKWRATADGTYFLVVDDKDISAETIYELRDDNLYVYHEATGRIFILKSFIYRMDGIWHKGKIYE